VTRPAVLVAAGLACLACFHVSCIELTGPARDAVDVGNVTAPEGVGVDSTCIPTGPEICFNARDDNCNGVIDEGCGLHTGILQFVIAWDAAEADVDLNVFDPGGEIARVGEATSSGLMKDRDCPRGTECQGQNVENVYLAEGDPRKGHYRVVVHLEKLNGATAPVRVRLGVRLGAKTYNGMVLELSPGQGTDEKEFGFDLR
jgi:tRNA (guanosine-2'-O-)-methyltransferase